MIKENSKAKLREISGLCLSVFSIRYILSVSKENRIWHSYFVVFRIFQDFTNTVQDFQILLECCLKVLRPAIPKIPEDFRSIVNRVFRM